LQNITGKYEMARELTYKKDLMVGGILMFLLVAIDLYTGSINVSISSNVNTEEAPVFYWSVIVAEVLAGTFFIYKGITKR